jgi:hypothetical protein
MRTFKHSIYGVRSNQSELERCCAQMTEIIRNTSGMMYSLMTTVDKYFPETYAVNQITAQVRGLAVLPPIMYVRITWRQRYPGVYFDNQDVIHRLQIKGIYIEMGEDYCQDPLFKDALGVTLI